jgi:AcrR family transcriptional regulator
MPHRPASRRNRVAPSRRQTADRSRPAAGRRGRYHHGNLRAALITAGVQLIQQKGVRALTLREIGRKVGVSRMAAYRHFADRAALLAAISEVGFTQFAARLEAARDSVPGDGHVPARLAAMALAYVRFAADHPAHYEVMFGPGGQYVRQQSEAAGRSFRILEETIQDGQRRGVVRAASSNDLARAVWAMVHGISTLGFQQGPDGEQFTRLCARILQEGLGAGGAAGSDPR